jgi:dTDP-4-amino-4,6-dideoxygalactose transaminase
LRIKLKGLNQGNAARRAHARYYGEQLAGLAGLTLPSVAEYGLPVYHIYAVRLKERDRILQALAQRGIACGIHYPKPVHLQKAYHSLGLGAGSFPVAEKCADEFLSLPMFPELTPAQLETVVQEIKSLLPLAKNLEAFSA